MAILLKGEIALSNDNKKIIWFENGVSIPYDGDAEVGTEVTLQFG